MLGLVPLAAFVTGFWRWRLRVAAERRSRARIRELLATAPASVREAIRTRGLADAAAE